MAFLPEKTYLEETLISAYDLSTGVSTFTSSDLAKFSSISMHFSSTGVGGSNSFVIEQSGDSTNWSTLLDNSELPAGDSNFVIDKAFFSGKLIRVQLVTNETGTLNCTLIAKR